jgi:hypothetical protein
LAGVVVRGRSVVAASKSFISAVGGIGVFHLITCGRVAKLFRVASWYRKDATDDDNFLASEKISLAI